MKIKTAARIFSVMKRMRLWIEAKFRTPSENRHTASFYLSYTFTLPKESN
jgi:hypothetical protein